MLSPARLCWLFGRIAGILLALAILWLFIAPGYNKVIVPISKIMSPGSVELTAKGADIPVEYTGFLVPPPRGMDVHGYMLHWTHRGGPFSIFTIGPWMPLIYVAFPAIIAGVSLAIARQATFTLTLSHKGERRGEGEKLFLRESPMPSCTGHCEG